MYANGSTNASGCASGGFSNTGGLGSKHPVSNAPANNHFTRRSYTPGIRALDRMSCERSHAEVTSRHGARVLLARFQSAVATAIVAVLCSDHDSHALSRLGAR